MDEFINQLLKDAHGADSVDSLDDETLSQLKIDLKSRLEDLINRRIIDSMDPETLERFNTLIDNSADDMSPLQKFIEDNVPSRSEITTQALLEFRDMYISR